MLAVSLYCIEYPQQYWWYPSTVLHLLYSADDTHWASPTVLKILHNTEHPQQYWVDVPEGKKSFSELLESFIKTYLFSLVWRFRNQNSWHSISSLLTVTCKGRNNGCITKVGSYVHPLTLNPAWELCVDIIRGFLYYLQKRNGRPSICPGRSEWYDGCSSKRTLAEREGEEQTDVAVSFKSCIIL